jgi:hypothetical protein
MGWIRLPAFQAGLLAGVEKAVRDFSDAPGIILDLRGNGGGVGLIGIAVARLFFENEASLGSVQMRKGESARLVQPAPRADATELAPKKSAHPPAFGNERGRVSVFGNRENKSLHFFGEAPERRPWAIKREVAPGRFCRALPNGSSGQGYRFCLHRPATYPAARGQYRHRAATESEKSGGDYRENFEGKQCGSLHNTNGVESRVARMRVYDGLSFESARRGVDAPSASVHACGSNSRPVSLPFSCPFRATKCRNVVQACANRGSPRVIDNE